MANITTDTTLNINSTPPTGVTRPVSSTFNYQTQAISSSAISGSNTNLTMAASSHGIQSGDVLYIQGVTGNTAYNGSHTVTAVSGTTVTIVTPSGSGTPIWTNATYYYEEHKALGTGLFRDENEVAVNTSSSIGIGNDTTTGTQISAGADLTIGPGVNFWSPGIRVRQGANLTSDGARLVINGGKVSTPIIGSTTTTTAVSDQSIGKVIVENGGTLHNVPTNPARFISWPGVNDLCSFRVNNASIIGAAGGTSLGGTNAGNNTSIFYLGIHSSYQDAELVGFSNYEFTHNINEFSNVSLVYPGTYTGESASKAALYQAGGNDIHVTLGGVATVSFPDRSSVPTDYMYYAMGQSNCSITFQQGVPSTIVNPEILWGQNGSGGTNGTKSRIVLQNELQISATKVDNDGVQSPSAGTYVFWNADNEQVINQTLNSNGNFATNQYYTWWEGEHNAFTTSVLSGRTASTGFVAPVGWPDARTEPSGENRMAFMNSAGTGSYSYNQTNSGAQAVRDAVSGTGTSTLTNLVTRVGSSVATDLRAGTRRGYPFVEAAMDFGYSPHYVNTGLGTTDIMPNSDSPTETQVRAAEASANQVRNGLSRVVALEKDFHVNRTKAQVDALTNVSLALDTTDATQMNISVSANATVADLYDKAHAWIFDNFADPDNYVWDVPSVPNNNSYDSDLGLTTNSAEPSSDEFALYTSSTGNSVSSGAAFNTIQEIAINEDVPGLGASGDRFSSGAILIYHPISTNWGLYTFERNENEQRGSADMSARLTYIASEGTVQDGDYYIQMAFNTHGLDVSVANPQRDFCQTNQMYAISGPQDTAILHNSVVTCASGAALTIGGTLNGGLGFGDNDSELRLGQNQLAVSLTGGANLASSRGVVSGFNESSSVASPAVASGVTVTGVNMQFEGGHTYYIAGDLSQANITRVGTGDVMLVRLESGVLPATLNSNVSATKSVQVVFRAAEGDTWNNSDNFTVQNAAFTTSQSDSDNLYLTTPTPTSNGTDLTYELSVDNNATVYYAFGSRKSDGGQWYNLASGSTTSSVHVVLMESLIDESPVAVESGDTGATALATYLSTDGRVAALDGALSSSNQLTVGFHNIATNLGNVSSRYILRLVQQQSNYLRAVAKGRYPINGMVFGQDRVTFNNENIIFQKASASDNLVKFAVQVLDSDGADASSNVTTTNVRTYILFNPPAAIGVIPEDTFNQLATRRDVQILY